MQKFLPKFAILACIVFILFVLPRTGFADFHIDFSGDNSSHTQVNVKQSSGTATVTIRQNGKLISQQSSSTLTPTVNVQESKLNTATPTPTLRPKRRIAWAFPTKTPTPSIQPSNTPKPSITAKPSATPTALPSNQRFLSPTPTSVVQQTDIKKTYIMNAINEYRKSLGLSSVTTSTETCNFANIRAQEISVNFNHDGFRNRIDNGTLPYKTWSQITENIAMTSDYKQVVNMWINSSGHAANMQKDTPYVCVESYGNYYAYEGMKP